MSSSESVVQNKDDKGSSSPKKFKAKTMPEIKALEIEKIFEYIEILHGLIKRQEKRMKKYKSKLNKLNKKSTMLKASENNELKADLQECPSLLENEKDTSVSNNGFTAQDAFSFVDEMRQAAEQAKNVSNFIYEPTSGLYYDQKSGYYYNAEYGLYYDGNTGCYYSFNQKKNSYEFHSQVQVQSKNSVRKDTNNAENLFENYEDDDIDEVVFDEFGVVTDVAKVKRLREEKQLQKELRIKKKSSKDKPRERKQTRSSYTKRKRSKPHTKSSEGNSDSEKDCKVEIADFEEGEITSSNSSSDSCSNSDYDDENRKIPIFKSGGKFQDIAKKYPPSLRIVVQETNLDGLKIGNLSLITFKGGSLGREGNHDVIIPDVNVSKFHLKFTYDTKQSMYKCVDLGSRNGTILNGIRMSASKTESNLFDLVHGSIIQIAQTKLLCHVHEGNSTCGLCEPGLLIEPTQREVSSASVLSHKEQLKKIQKKYGLENEKFKDSKQSIGNIGVGAEVESIKNSKSFYQDRAATRRLKVGSSTDKEKTQIASVDTAISSENKGFKLLSKLGWSKGEALGKTQESGGLLEPINVGSNSGHKGLGCNDPTIGQMLTTSDKKKLELIKKTQERYRAADIFTNIYDSDST